MLKFMLLVAANTLLCATVLAQAPATVSTPAPVPVPSTGAPEPETLLVFGEQPGPGMWKVTKGDNVLWVIGTQTPLPQKMRWRAREVKQVIAQAQEVLPPPSVNVSIGDIGYFRALTLLPSAMEARKNPKNALLKDVVPADLYPRWLALRDKYVDEFNTDDESKDIERWRPMFAAFELYSKAVRKSGMSFENAVWPVVQQAAKANKVSIRDIRVKPKIKDPRRAVKEFEATPLADLDCFRKTIERIETDLAAMRLRANAWASGDIEALKKLPFTDQRAACSEAIQNAGFVKTLGIQDITTVLKNTWLEAAEDALTKNKVTLAVLPIRELISDTGYLAALRAKGYPVTGPDTQ
jgi:hypothetical protein